eukprot:COSAG03_NODE_1548_length_3894_cov_36.405007_3_plen_165_part_00
MSTVTLARTTTARKLGSPVPRSSRRSGLLAAPTTRGSGRPASTRSLCGKPTSLDRASRKSRGFASRRCARASVCLCVCLSACLMLTLTLSPFLLSLCLFGSVSPGARGPRALPERLHPLLGRLGERTALSALPLIFSYKSEKSLCGAVQAAAVELPLPRLPEWI